MSALTSTSTTLHCDAEDCPQSVRSLGTAEEARASAVLLGWSTGGIPVWITDWCPTHAAPKDRQGHAAGCPALLASRGDEHCECSRYNENRR